MNPGSSPAVSTLLLALFAAASAGAVDGAIEINQARVDAGGIAPGDAPGDPVTIDAPGSYVLTGNIASPTVSLIIDVVVDDVHIDLNGFHVTGYIRGNSPPASARTVVENGFVHGSGLTLGDESVLRNLVLDEVFTGCGNDCLIVDTTATAPTASPSIQCGTGCRIARVTLYDSAGGLICGGNCVIEGCTLRGNLGFLSGTALSAGANSIVRDNVVSNIANGNGIVAGISSRVAGNSVQGVAFDGIRVGSDSIVQDNTVADAGGEGIEAMGTCRISGNVVRNGTSFGILAPDACTVEGNTVSEYQQTGAIAVSVASGSNVVGNTLRNNDTAISTSTDSVYSRNVLTGNGTDHSGTGVSAGDNFCDGSSC